MWKNLKISIQNVNSQNANADIKVAFIAKDNLSSTKDKELLENLWADAKGSFLAQDSKILYVGLSLDSKSATMSDSSEVYVYQEAGCSAVRALKNLKIKSASMDLGEFSKEAIFHILQGLWLGFYEYRGLKSSDENHSLEISLSGVEESSLKDSKIICDSVNFVRDIVNTPPNIANSVYLSELAQNEVNKLSKELKNPEIKAINRSNSYMEEQKMGAFVAVNSASNFPAFLTHLIYKPSSVSENTKKVAIVGKGLVYDTGGLSLKPADYMTTMKADKGGACAVLGTFMAAARLNLNIELHAIMGITDNAIGKSAYRPDDILVSREKKSIEVKNTDAEGRLVLADCLSYAQDLDVDIILDFATLTGACVVALGEYTSGVMGFNENLKQDFVNAALQSGELAHTLPFNKHLKKLIESKVADVSNTSSSRYGGAITAGLFLSEFIRDEYKDKWLHIDIAGPAFVEKDWGVNPHGASGAGVRACVAFLDKIAKN